MAYIKGYDYDIFISYSHLDNQKSFNQVQGWIELFCAELNLIISQRLGMPDVIKIWWDNKKLDGSILFNDSIAEGINRSAILICLTSPAYLKSAYCQKELELFYKKVQHESIGLKVGDRSRIINVLLNNISHTQWPEQFNGATGFPFYDAKDKDDLGDPLDVANPQFKNQLKDLRNALVKLIDDLLKEAPDNNAPGLLKEEKFSIFFGDVADSLRTTRKRTITELEKKGFSIVYDLPPPFETVAHQKAVTGQFERINLAVHLLDQYPGREIEDGEGISYPQRQVEVGFESDKPQVVWLPLETNIEAIEEEPYKNFIQYLEKGKSSSKSIKYIRGTKSTLTNDISDIVEQLKMQQKPQPSKGKMSVLLDAHLEDAKYAWELGMSLTENQIRPVLIDPQEDNPLDNSTMLGDRISQVNKLVFFYGKVDWTWVQRRVNAAMKFIFNNQCAADEFFIFMVPPHKELTNISFERRFIKVNVIDNSNTAQLDKIALEQFFKTIKSVS